MSSVPYFFPDLSGVAPRASLKVSHSSDLKMASVQDNLVGQSEFIHCIVILLLYYYITIMLYYYTLYYYITILICYDYNVIILYIILLYY